MSNHRPVLSVVFVTGEENSINSVGLPTLKVYVSGEHLVVEDSQQIKAALIESLKHLGQEYHSVVFLAVEIVSVTERKRRGAA